MNHDLLCNKKCKKCNNTCYAHPDMPLNEHKCKDCLIKDGELIEEDLGFLKGVKRLYMDCGIIINYFKHKWKVN